MAGGGSQTGTGEDSKLAKIVDYPKFAIGLGLGSVAGTAALTVGLLIPMPEWGKIIDFSLAGANYVSAGVNYLLYRKQRREELLAATEKFAKNYSTFVKD